MSAVEKVRQAVEVMASQGAVAAREAGQSIYAPRLDGPSMIARGMQVDTFGLAIGAIEHEGWSLEHWATDGRVAWPVFRRDYES